MISKPIHEIDRTVLQGLVDNEVHEGKTIEYKRELPGHADSEKVPFLATLSSFANTAGGDLLLGVAAEDGVPKALDGIEIANLDKQKLRIEQIVANGLEPRLPRINLQPVEVAEKRYVLVVRVPRSWVAPHRVRKNDKFYGRNSAGKYPLDVGEVRTAFTLSDTVTERIRAFRTHRIAMVLEGESPVTLVEGGRVVFHLVPLASFAAPLTLDVVAAYDSRQIQILPLTAHGWTSVSDRINLDGVATYLGAEPDMAFAYTQLFRTGVIEAVFPLERKPDGYIYLSGTEIEGELIEGLKSYLPALRDLGIDPPIYAFLSLVGIYGCTLRGEGLRVTIAQASGLKQDVVNFPEAVVERYDSEPGALLRPIFDILWNTFGYRCTPNYDKHGNWVGRR